MEYIILTQEDIQFINNRAVICNSENGELVIYEPVNEELVEYFVNHNRITETNVIIPKTITPRQGQLLLSRRGQLTMVEQVIYNIETITGDKQLAEEATIEWNKASSWDRQNNTVQFIADLLMWNDEDKDLFFIEANKIE